MFEQIIDIQLSSRKHSKKYMATVRHKNKNTIRKIHFGDKRYQHFEDKTDLRTFGYLNHNDMKRRNNYYSRFSKTTNRNEAIILEMLKYGRVFTPKILSHIYLW